jgi:serine/threonine protein kinase
MSPEQVRGKELDARTDLFSFGAVLYEVCTGTLLFRGETPGVMFKAILDGDQNPGVRLNPAVSPGLEQFPTGGKTQLGPLDFKLQQKCH